MKELSKTIQGRGEVKGRTFTQTKKGNKAYIYKVNGKNPYFEVFKRKENKRFNQISYPTAKSFGKWAWTFNTLEKALIKFNKLEK